MVKKKWKQKNPHCLNSSKIQSKNRSKRQIDTTKIHIKMTAYFMDRHRHININSGGVKLVLGARTYHPYLWNDTVVQVFVRCEYIDNPPTQPGEWKFIILFVSSLNFFSSNIPLCIILWCSNRENGGGVRI
jgi:hypothetical protein